MKNTLFCFKQRFGPINFIYFIVAVLGFITRLYLFFKSWPFLDLNMFSFFGIFIIGFFYDCVVATFFSVPLLFYCWLMKDSWYQKKWNLIPLYAMLTIELCLLLMNVVGEVTFWDEFGVRYNFIAVDYLIYTNEVIGNISESYNLPVIISAVLLAALLFLLLFRKMINKSTQVSERFKKRTLLFLIYFSLPIFAYFFVNNKFKQISKNNYVNELSSSGIYEFGVAFWNNEIDYQQFYLTRNDEQNISSLRNYLRVQNMQYLGDSLGIERVVQPDSPQKKLNIVLISVESFSADFMKHFGNNENITPYLDSLIPHSLLFENFYATGTRTVRGLEALSLAIPPTPGQSIVRRPGNENMFTIGSVLKGINYDVKYIYGGNSFFDNMGYFFSHSGYQVIDKRDIPAKQIHHETAWGVADEDAFNVALRECDKSNAQGKLFFSHIMTVSNHRPYTFPDGRINIPSASKSRQGAVKYTDFAINQFIKNAQQKPWFNNTIFVIVADHCASSAGKTDLPINKYHIPCLIYAPALIQPRIETKMTSQIDLAPTLLGMLNVSYKSKFLGLDINNCLPGNERVFVSTYQDMGYLKNDTLVVLSPKKRVAMYKVNIQTNVSTPIPLETNKVNEAISWYQGASFLYGSKRYKAN
jgi:phosphoglycerol transferase MdoB-like AlkP superfamily enzyme